MKLELRPYQTQAIANVRDCVRRGKKRVVVVAPTGAGKTTIAASIIEGANAKGSHCLFLAHRKELIDQASARLDSIGIDHGVIQADHPRARAWLPTQVASIPTLVRRLDRKPQAQLIIVDECHHALSESYLKVLNSYPGAIVLGLTATPWRLDGKGLHGIFDDLVVVAQARELVPDYLMEPRVFAPDRPNLSKVHTKAGDYDLNELEDVMNSAKLVGNVVEHQQRYASGIRSLVFAVTVKHSLILRDRFRDVGVAAEHLDANTPPVERMAILNRLKAGEIQVVCNVGILTEGYDLPLLGCVSLARPTQSSSLYLQMVGRIMRPAPGKPAPIVLDHADCVRRHGHPLDEREYSLEDIERPKGRKKSEEEDEDKAKVCKTCFAVCPRNATVCPECGAPFVGEGRKVVESGGELTEQRTTRTMVAATSNLCAQCGSRNIRPIRKPEWGRYRTFVVCYGCGHKEFRVEVAPRASRDEKRAEYDRLEKIRLAKGFERGWVWHRYKEVFGTWPARYS